MTPLDRFLLSAALALAAASGSARAAPSADNPTVKDPLSGITFVRMAKGCYQMGVPADAFADQDGAFRRRVERTEGPVHEACIDEFWIARHEITEAQWRAVMGPRPGAGADDLPVSGTSWQEAVAFTARLSERAGPGWRYRLPTEAEWEYACRAGSAPVTALPDRGRMDGVAWYSSPYGRASAGKRPRNPQPAGRMSGNAAGLHDMLGNVWEWTLDAYADDAYRRHALFNPRIDSAAHGVSRTARGGSIRSDIRWMRCEARTSLDAETRLDTVGFRVVRVPSGGK